MKYTLKYNNKIKLYLLFLYKFIIMFENFEGDVYRLANNWYEFIDVNEFSQRPINYLEIGVFYGGNLLSVGATYASHEQSRMYCVDPWEDYDDYTEYKNRQPEIYKNFINNVETSGFKEKIIVNRGYSNVEVPKFQDDFFDIVYIDGNHGPEYVLEDAVLSFRKLKSGGIMIFDDYGWGGPDYTQKGVDAFLNSYIKKIDVLGEKETQLFIRKI